MYYIFGKLLGFERQFFGIPEPDPKFSQTRDLISKPLPRLSVPIAEPSDLAVHPELEPYSDGSVVAVRFQTAPRSEQRCGQEVYRKSEPDC